MLKNYLKISIRSLLKNRGYSAINILGLAIGLTAFLLIFNYVRYERSYESFHEKADNIYRVTTDLYRGAEYDVTDCETHAPLGPLLKESMPEVLDYVRMFGADGIQEIKAGGENFLEEGIYFSDPSIFNVFSIDVVEGNAKSALSSPYKAVIDVALARKYFGSNNVVGQSLKVNNIEFHITAVMANQPANTHLKYRMLLSHSTYPIISDWYKEDSWNGNNEYTYLLMEPNTDLLRFNQKLTALSLSLADKIDQARFVGEPIKEIHLYSNKTFEPEANGNARSVYFLALIAIFIVIIAWVNYINLATARALERAREVGIRKIMGSARSQLIFQFLSESFIVNLISAAFALLFLYFSLPFFRDLTGKPLSLNFLTFDTFWYQFIYLLGFGTLLSGFYPALVLSSFDPVSILKGKFRSSSHGQRLRQGLVVFQFCSTVILLICVLTVYFQIKHLQTFDLGMNIDQTVAVRAPNLSRTDSISQSTYSSLKTELLRVPHVKYVAASEGLPGLSLHELNTTSFSRLGQNESEGQYEYYWFPVDEDFIPTLNMTMAAGRNFEKGINDDQVIINEEAAVKLGFSNPQEAVGTKISFQTRWPGEPSTIIGVVQNFYLRSPKEAHLPVLFMHDMDASYFTIRLDNTNMQEAISSIEATWEKILPNSTFHYFFLDERFNQQYQADTRFGKVMGTFSGLAMIIACLGLFGLSSYIIVQRTKEIGIRKVLGASVIEIVQLLSRDFVRVIIIASLIALPIAWYAMEQWLSNYAIRIDLNVWIFILPMIAMLLIALFTASLQTIKVAQTNPVDTLKE